jgi:hypothetical protein
MPQEEMPLTNKESNGSRRIQGSAKSRKGERKMIVNLTPHTIKVVNSDNEIIREYPSQGIARVATTAEVIDEIDGIQVVRTKFGAIQGLPEPDGESIFIVSMVVAQAVSERQDIIAPDTGPTAYRENKLIVGVRQFARY